jgi:hypothetical protein
MRTIQRHKLQTLTEAQFQSQVVEWAKVYGWRVHGERPAQYRDGRWATHIQGHAGFPDLVLVRGPRLIFAELKVGKNKPAAEQYAWHQALFDARSGSPHLEMYVWRPEEWSQILVLLSRS